MLRLCHSETFEAIVTKGYKSLMNVRSESNYVQPGSWVIVVVFASRPFDPRIAECCRDERQSLREIVCSKVSPSGRRVLFDDLAEWYPNQGCEWLCWRLRHLAGHDWKRDVAALSAFNAC